MRLLESISIYAGGPGSGCNPAAGKCGRHPGLQEEDVVALKVPVKSWDGRTWNRRTYGIGTKATVINVLPKVGNQPGKVLIKLPTGMSEHVNQDDVFLVKPRKEPDIPETRAPRSKVKQQYTASDGAKVTIFKTKDNTEKDSKNVTDRTHALSGKFRAETKWINGVSDRAGMDLQSRAFTALKRGGEGAGATVMVFRYKDQDTGKVKGVAIQEHNYGQYSYRYGDLKTFQYKNAGSASGMLKRRYGISLRTKEF